MQKKTLLIWLLCLTLLLAALAGCSPAPGSREGSGNQSAASGGSAADAPSGDAQAPGPGETAATPAPTPGPVQLSSGLYDADLTELRAVILPADLPLLDGFSRLQTLDASGSDCQEELVAWALAHPHVSVRCQVRMPDGSVLPADTRELDLTGTEDMAGLTCLALLPDLRTVELGSCLAAADSGMDWTGLAAAEAACPWAEFHYAFSLYGKRFDLQSTEVDLNHITMTDEGALVKKVTACMPQLSYLDMDFCEVSNEAMAEIRDSLPQAEVVWRIWFGEGRRGYSVRTNVTTILASNPDRAGDLTPENAEALKYCTKVKYLDLGHNNALVDLSFVRYMPDLEVAVLAMGGYSDLSPLADCPKLEYLELQTSGVSDLRPLSGLKNLRHLNLCDNFCLTDITPLYELTELERLYLGMYVPVPKEQVEEMQRRAPNCEINVTTENPTGEEWRYTSIDAGGHGVLHPRYALLYEQFHYGAAPYCYSYWNNDPLYRPHN